MQRAHKIDKSPVMCTGPEDLLPGDILIFNHNPAARNLDSGGFMTLHNQTFLNERGGHRTSVHSGFIIDTPTGKKLAHVVGKGLFIDDLDNKFLKRTVHVYRPRKYRNELAAALKAIVDDHSDAHSNDDEGKVEDISNMSELLEPVEVRREQINKLKEKVNKFRWDVSVAIRSLIHRIFTSIMIVNNNPFSMDAPVEEKLPDNVISRNTICSKYVADTYIAACNRMSNEFNRNADNNQIKVNYSSYYMNISSLTPPKALQAYLYRNTNYDYLVLPHTRDQLYTKLKGVIQTEINRLKHKFLRIHHRKAEQLERALADFEKLPSQPDMMQQSIALLKVLSPILKYNTGGGFVTATSYKRVMAFANSEGIYSDYIDYDLHDKREGKKYRELAQTYYNFNPALAELYRGYRRKGYSDEEAKFECKPSFGDWFKLCPARNIFLTCTVIGFFAWVLPHGLRREAAAKRRNENRELWHEILSPLKK